MDFDVVIVQIIGRIFGVSTMVAKSVGTNSKILALFCPLPPLPPYNVDLFRDMG